MSSNYVAPNQQKNLRACMVCSIVQLASKFVSQGCPNCEDFLNMRGSSDAVNDCCSSVFEGCIVLIDPKTSWVAKWQRLGGYVPGMYACKVTGILPEDIIQTVEDAGVKYIPRDGSNIEEEVV